MNYKKIQLVEKTDALIKQTVKIECRRYMPKGKMWSVTHESGWPTDRALNIQMRMDKNAVREFLGNLNFQMERQT